MDRLKKLNTTRLAAAAVLVLGVAGQQMRRRWKEQEGQMKRQRSGRRDGCGTQPGSCRSTADMAVAFRAFLWGKVSDDRRVREKRSG